ncbi:hypothetical protein PIROE2DRAFT_11053 [Piromyces sp. E2]|nr:hypothetical protein PIROE2DRAFT_11053 [Piromyces sp. E2]|eukprot:OUM62618.1 hypothetical protein PIROE2DRAFT_11053 [Piromyces sp. E2]
MIKYIYVKTFCKINIENDKFVNPEKCNVYVLIEGCYMSCSRKKKIVRKS